MIFYDYLLLFVDLLSVNMQLLQFYRGLHVLRGWTGGRGYGDKVGGMGGGGAGSGGRGGGDRGGGESGKIWARN